VHQIDSPNREVGDFEGLEIRTDSLRRLDKYAARLPALHVV